MKTVAPKSEAEADRPIPTLGRLIAIARGKGGVGKSTVSANLAAILARRRLRVGLVDADLYGPSIPGIPAD
ncbi:hypothetical protein U879_07090 [Defluviimonas sp. 20V17]|uniref:ATP-binding protein involved in chromosome partitioning n=1 Tax=Allgaiera indica TaxID=765699 RepID=A0AAN4UUY3_9RHOB|nr:hypothetical protein U879_07090 [Defluviimonas sp. 20V17]GHE06065.1 hypothetical protein GCM10008024_39240 [Allgaiera indica]SDX84135.1 ATP-binding protein involved in chromosome partitioning [Allgaiera indica]